MNLDSICDSLLSENRLVDLYRLTRFFYKYTREGLIDDPSYAVLENLLRSMNLGKPFTDQTYDDDGIPDDLIQEFSLQGVLDEFLSMDTGVDPVWLESLNEDKSLSIRPREDYVEAYNYFQEICSSLSGDDLLIFTPKVNGWNTRTVYKDNYFRCTLSRARKAKTPMDFTQNSKYLFPSKINFTDNCTVVAELVADLNKYRELPREGSCQEPFTSARMAAGSLIRTCKDRSLLKHLHFYAFNADGIANTIHETLDILSDNGFDTVPYWLVPVKEVPEGFENFCVWLKNYLDVIWDKSLELQMPTDGVVVDVDNKNYVSDVHNQYADRNCALKFEHWSYAYYEAIVKSIEFEQRSVQCSCVILIEPLQTDDNVCAQRVSGYTLAQLIANDVHKGSVICFARSSEAINVLISKDKAAEISKLPKSIKNIINKEDCKC